MGNARAFAGFLASAFGFEPVGYAGPGDRARATGCPTCCEQGRIRFLVTGALTPDSPIAEHVRPTATACATCASWSTTPRPRLRRRRWRGAPCPERAPAVDEDEHGAIHHAAIRTYGETVHTFLDRSAYTGLFAPQFAAAGAAGSASGRRSGSTRFDHIVGNVELGHLDEWVGYYEKVLGFDQLVHFGDDQISTEYSALMSTVVWNHDKVVLPINEPAEGRRKSQIEEYLDYYRSPGVQHMALHTPDIVHAVRALRDRGVRFLDVPPEYYDEARARMAGDRPAVGPTLAELGIMVDRDQDGHLLQIFTETVCDRPTVFFEIIQREGAKGFGEGNFKALFEAIERAQAARGNL